MSPIPHEFPSLIGNSYRSVIIIGHGMSSNLPDSPPIPDDLFLNKREQAENSLGINGIGENLYDWADSIISQLTASGHDVPKLKLAFALGLTKDDCWKSRETVVSTVSLHHLIIARLALENRWKGIWSLNWDCNIESALEAIGLKRFDDNQTMESYPWITKYSTYINTSDTESSGREDIITVFKPHGCARSLAEAKELFENNMIIKAQALAQRFLITSSELHDQGDSAEDRAFSDKLRDQIRENPLIVAGWRISEDYLKNAIIESRDGQENSLPDRLSIIDLAFQHNTHGIIADAYSYEESDVFFQLVINSSEGIKRDDLFLWIQTLYALNELKKHVPDEYSSFLDELSTEFSQPHPNHFLNKWVNYFLPSWLRLCWRAGLIECLDFSSETLSLELEHQHIPWRIEHIPRPDLKSIIRLLSQLNEQPDNWDTEFVPGALWQRSTWTLVIPLPASMDLYANVLRAHKPFLKRLEGKLGYIKKMEIMPISLEQNMIVSSEVKEDLKFSISNLIGLTRFANVSQLDIRMDL